MTISTHYEWLTLPYPTLGAAAAAAGTTQQCSDGQTIVIWDTGTMRCQVWTNNAWTAPIPLPAVPLSFSCPWMGRICFLTTRGPGDTQFLWSIELSGNLQFRSPDVSLVNFPAFPAALGNYTLWNQGALAVYAFPDRPERVWLAYQDLTGKSLMVGWFIPNVTLPLDVLTFDDREVSIQLIQQGSQKGNPTLFGEPSFLMGLRPGWMFNHNFGGPATDTSGCASFAALDGWGIISYPNTILFGAPVSITWLVTRQHYAGHLFNRDGIAGWPLTLDSMTAGGGHVQGRRAFATFTPGGPLASVLFAPFDPYAELFRLPLLAGPPASTGTNWHGFLLRDIPYLLDDAGHFVFLGLVTLETALDFTTNFETFGLVRKR